MPDNMQHSIPSLLDEIRESLRLLESDLPTFVDGWALSQSSKLPYKVLVYRNSLTWRMAELSRTAFEAFVNDRLASAIVLTRAAFETTAALWYLGAKLSDTIDAGKIGDIDDYLMKMIVGVATDPPIDPTTGESLVPRPIKIGKFLDSVEKDIEGFKRQYGYLSEYAHPNWAGTVYLYSRNNKGKATTDFGANIRATENTKLIGVTNLSGALSIFERSCRHTADLIPAFTKLCEHRSKAVSSA